jgi:hypothetical protein
LKYTFEKQDMKVEPGLFGKRKENSGSAEGSKRGQWEGDMY